MPGSLVLIGHGSHLSGDSSAPVRTHAAAIARTGRFDDVRMGFWKEEPSLARALDGCRGDEVTVVPLFMSNGYFTEEVIPREMRLDGHVTSIDGRQVKYTEPIGTHPALADVILHRADEAGAGGADAIVVLGHGTTRNDRSAANVYKQAKIVAKKRPNTEVITLFMDQDPNLREVFERVESKSVVMVPLFVSDGWHVGETIPDDLVLEGITERADGRRLKFTPAVGTHPRVVDVVNELVSEADTW